MEGAEIQHARARESVREKEVRNDKSFFSDPPARQSPAPDKGTC